MTDVRSDKRPPLPGRLGDLVASDGARSEVALRPEHVPPNAVERNEARHDPHNEQAKILDAFFEHTQTSLVLLDPQFNFVRVNDAYARACRRDPSEFAGRNHFELYPSPLIHDFQRVVRDKTPCSIHARPFVFPDHPEWGTTYWDLAVVPIVNPRDEVVQLVFSLHDVTPVVRAEEERARLLASLNSALERARSEEQARIGRDLHDDVGGRLAALILELDAAIETVPEGARAGVCHAREGVRAVLEDLLRIVRGMHPQSLEVLGLVGALEQAGQAFERAHGVATQLVLEGIDGSIDANTALALYRIVQGALSNVGRHAGAKAVSVVVRSDGQGALRIVVEYDGRGFDPQAARHRDGLGLPSMSARAALLGGSLTVESELGKGTAVHATVPWPAQSTSSGTIER